MFGALLALMALQSAQPVEETITVVGKREALKDYELCLAGGCDPVRDVNATLAYAQQRILAGDYRASHQALKRALRRTAGAANTHPSAISALHDANSTVALHVGDQDDARRSGLRSVSLLRDAHGPADPRGIAARARIGDVEAKIGNFAQADMAYRSSAEAARKAGLPLLADVVEMRRAWLLSQMGQEGAAQSQLTRIAGDVSRDQAVRLQASVLAARLARARRDHDAADRLLAAVGTQKAGSKPLLTWAPKIEIASAAAAIAEARKWGDRVDGLEPSSGESIPIRWADIGFWVRPDGTVADAEVLRGSPSRDWTVPVTNAIRGRQYAPVEATAGDPGRYRIERFTLTAKMDIPKGSLIRRRIGPPDIRMIDITDDPNRAPDS